jgi:hypothetical protein
MAGEDGLPKLDFDKLFTPREANELIPTLEVLIRELQVRADYLRERIGDLLGEDAAIESQPLAQIIERYPQLREPASRMAEIAGKIDSLGCFLKDIDQGLVDFPWELDDGRVAFLCWQFGEAAVIAWHTVESGFGQRRPLPGAAKPYLN